MPSHYLSGYGTRQTPQSQPIPGSTQVPNSAGGYAWQVDDWTRLDRFLILGSSGGSFYAGQHALTAENADAARRCIQKDARETIRRIVAVSTAGRAPKQDPVIFALAMAAGSPDAEARTAALEAVPLVCRTGTHLFMFTEFVQQFRGWGRGLRRAIAGWYNREDLDALGYQVVKYRQRNGWTHRDLLRLSHPEPRTSGHDRLYKWILGKPDADGQVPPSVAAYHAAVTATGPQQVVAAIEAFGDRLPWEAIPDEHLSRDVWDALLHTGLPMTALIRKLPVLTRLGVVAPMSAGTRLVVEQLGDVERLVKARVHPLAVLVALKTYESGQSARGRGTWQAVPAIVDALDRAFYDAFGAVEPSGKRTMLALDVSASMGWAEIAGMPGITPRVGSAAMALVTAAVEPQHIITAFSHGLVPVTVSPRQRLDDVIRTISRLPHGGTDCSLPILAALGNRMEVDTFVVYTDSETWAGQMHPVQALRMYREQMGIPAKLVVVGMVSNGFTIADPDDGGMLDVVGFDLNTPNVISQFSAGAL